jgi:AcrR family transcriptional regulator
VGSVQEEGVTVPGFGDSVAVAVRAPPRRPRDLAYGEYVVTEDRTGDRPGRGRPRTPGMRRAILDAALRVLAGQGLENFSVAKVAAEAGTTKATVYSRYPTRMALIGAALEHLRIEDGPEPAGDIRTELAQLLDRMVAQYQRVGGMSIVGSCLAAEERSPELLETIRASTFLPRRETFMLALRRGQDAGQVRPDADLEQVASALIGTFYGDHLAGREITEDWSCRVVETLLTGIANPACERSS